MKLSHLSNTFNQDALKAQIAGLLADSANTAVAPDSKNYDQELRATMVANLVELGLDQHAAEVAVETNADLWREQAMTRTFQNRHNFAAALKKNQEIFAGPCGHLDEFYDEYCAAWLKYREFNYYLQHRDIVNELGTATANMKITDPALARLERKIAGYEEMSAQMGFTNHERSL